MGKNTKPILSVLVDEDKKERFAELARRHKHSMGWILNDCIDRMLAADSIDIYRNSISIEETPTEASTGLSTESIEEIVRVSLSKHLEDISGYVSLESIEKHLDDKVLNIPSIGDINSRLAEIESLYRRLQGDLEAVKKATSGGEVSPFQTVKTQTIDTTAKSWTEFHAMVELEPPPRNGKTKANADIALAKAIEMEITGWRFDSGSKNFKLTT